MAEKTARKFVGLTGTFASGKGTIIELAKELYGKKAASISTSDIVREETTKLGLTQERPNQQRVANELRATKGAGVLAEMALERAEKLPPQVELVLVDGIRNPGEVNVLRKLGKSFRLWAVDAPIEARYQRIKSRAREGESVLSFEEFKASEAREKRGQDSSGQLIGACMEMADDRLENNGSREELEKKVALLLEKFS